MKHNETAGRQRWQSASRLAPDGAPRSHTEFELRNALEESSMRRTELIQKLREVHSCLDTQTDLLKAKETQLQHSQSSTQLLELKQKVGLFFRLKSALKGLKMLQKYYEVCIYVLLYYVIFQFKRTRNMFSRNLTNLLCLCMCNWFLEWSDFYFQFCFICYIWSMLFLCNWV